MMNKFYHGDCLFVMKKDIDPESVDLVYLDPPFFTGQVQKGVDKWNPGAMEISYNDTKSYWGQHLDKMRKDAPTWLNSIPREDEFKAYIYYMMQRLLGCRNVLKNTGSIYLHCDWRASHYLKMVMDEVFGYRNFRNEIAWCYTGPGSPGMQQFMRKHDIILYYSKSNQWVFHPSKLPYKDGAPHSGGFEHSLDIDHYREIGGKVPEDWWVDIAIAARSSKERTGYPTQKPVALLRRIIEASSNKGDVVLDPFCGCGTAIIAANELGREWIGIDISKDALNITKGRDRQMTLDQGRSFSGVERIERDLSEIEKLNPHEFEKWVNEFYKATKPMPDKGVDGVMPDGTPIQTKSFCVEQKYLSQFITDVKFHHSVLRTIKRMVMVSQVGFDNNTRKLKYESEMADGIKIELLTPTDMMESDVQLLKQEVNA
jgi:DNA modification methylase